MRSVYLKVFDGEYFYQINLVYPVDLPIGFNNCCVLWKVSYILYVLTEPYHHKWDVAQGHFFSRVNLVGIQFFF